MLASGLSDILVESVSATELFVSWSVPTMPNGIISAYTLYRRVGNGNFVQIAQGKYNDYFFGVIITLIIKRLCIGLLLSYNDTSLLPFYEYQYSLEVTNGAGSIAYGNSNPTQTLASTPLAGVTLNASTTTSSIILLQWIAPSIDLLRGGIVNFEVIGYQVVSAQIVTSFYNGTDTMFSVSGLNPSTSYGFRVSFNCFIFCKFVFSIVDY